MARKRQGRAGFFTGASRIRQTRTLPVDPPAALAALQGTVYDWDLGSDVLTWGPNAAAVFGVSAAALPRTGEAFSRLIEPGFGTGDRNAFLGDGAPSRRVDLRYAIRFGSEQVVLVQETSRRIPDAQGRPGTVRGLLRVDRSGRDLLPEAIRARTALLARLNEDIAEALRFSHSVTLIVGSVESPGSVEHLARLIRPMMRRRDHLTVLSPNRFALALTSCLAWDAMSAMKRLAGLAAAQSVTVRLGAACAPDHAFEPADLVRLAEEAHEKAIAASATAVLHDVRQGLAAVRPGAGDPSLDILQALNERRLTLGLQPVVDAQSRMPVLVQACAWLSGAADGSPAGGPLSLTTDDPALPLLADGRLLELAADHLVRHEDTRIALPIAPATLHDAEWLPMLAAHLGARPGIESRLMIDVPESVLRHSGTIRGRLDAMKALGVGVVLSGFGSGHAAFGTLRNLPVDLLRIDGIFIQSLGRSTDDRLFVQRLIDIAQHLGIATVADWVEDEASAQRLAAWGVDYLQGGLPGGPAPVALPRLAPQRARRA